MNITIGIIVVYLFLQMQILALPLRIFLNTEIIFEEGEESE